MTVQQAKQEVDSCERAINESYGKMASDVSSMTQRVRDEAASAKLRRTLLPLILCIIGLIAVSGSPFVGIVLIVGGIYWSVKVGQNAKYTVGQIKAAANDLDGTVSRNRKI